MNRMTGRRGGVGACALGTVVIALATLPGCCRELTAERDALTAERDVLRRALIACRDSCPPKENQPTKKRADPLVQAVPSFALAEAETVEIGKSVTVWVYFGYLPDAAHATCWGGLASDGVAYKVVCDHPEYVTGEEQPIPVQAGKYEVSFKLTGAAAGTLHYQIKTMGNEGCAEGTLEVVAGH